MSDERTLRDDEVDTRTREFAAAETAPREASKVLPREVVVWILEHGQPTLPEAVRALTRTDEALREERDRLREKLERIGPLLHDAVDVLDAQGGGGGE